jgi:hypothetical protein
MGIIVTGSVGDIIAPNKKPIIRGACVRNENKKATRTIVTTIPSVSRDAILANSFLTILKSILWLSAYNTITIPRMPRPTDA